MATIALRGDLSKDGDTWQWAGVWAFNTVPQHASLATHSRRVKNPVARPFAYTWKDTKQATDVLVPSANLPKDNRDEGADQTNSWIQSKEDEEPASSETAQQSVKDAVLKVNAEAETPKDVGALDGVKKQLDNKEAGNIADNESSNIAATKSRPGESISQKAGNNELIPDNEKNNDDQKAVMPAEGKEGDTTSTNQDQEMTTMREKSKESKEKKDDTAGVSNQGNAAELEIEQAASTKVELPKDAVTFASTTQDEPDYTQASTIYPEKCPVDGGWTGYFENASTRRDRNSSRVPETFSLFFNATPADDARVLFRDAEENSSATKMTPDGAAAEAKSPMLPKGHVHVRGVGENQFGMFEIVGGFDPETGILECQRIYILTEDGSSSRGRSLASPRVARSPSLAGSTDGTPRAYNTRKRQLTWKRANVSDDEYEDFGRRGSAKKRPRSTDGRRSPGATATATPKGKAAVSIPHEAGGIKRAATSPRSGGSSTGQTARKRPPPNKEGTISANYMKLPAVGDPKQARWRAAHFLYYQRNDPSTDDSGSSPNAAPRFVVYEGEMLQGDSLRDGRGVCLYSNGTLYEGEWKRNKEHGKGTLMSSDRRRTIYTGDWERGRMHGKGVYNYSHENSLYRRSMEEKGDKGGSRYEGDFKENARHGVGRYVLHNGSVYDGEWRDNVMSGRGTFYWVDGSVYVGSWKDGERNGQGILRTSDGFTFDGSWVRNAMEGRGIATYPNGQRYEGLWVGGKREGRGTINFTNGAVYEGRFRGDYIEGQGTMKMHKNVAVTKPETRDAGIDQEIEGDKDDWMIPINFQSDMGHIHQKAGFTSGGA